MLTSFLLEDGEYKRDLSDRLDKHGDRRSVSSVEDVVLRPLQAVVRRRPPVVEGVADERHDLLRAAQAQPLAQAVGLSSVAPAIKQLHNGCQLLAVLLQRKVSTYEQVFELLEGGRVEAPQDLYVLLGELERGALKVDVEARRVCEIGGRVGGWVGG